MIFPRALSKTCLNWLKYRYIRNSSKKENNTYSEVQSLNQMRIISISFSLHWIPCVLHQHHLNLAWAIDFDYGNYFNTRFKFFCNCWLLKEKNKKWQESRFRRKHQETWIKLCSVFAFKWVSWISFSLREIDWFVLTEFWASISFSSVNIQSDQNMMIPKLSGIHMNFSFEVSSYSGQTVSSHCGRWLNVEMVNTESVPKERLVKRDS